MKTVARKLNPVWLKPEETGAAKAGLLSTKLHIPKIHPHRVVRPRLLARLNEVTQYNLTLISAPAGYGKTTLLSEWAAGSELPVAWLSLDEQDNDPVQFWAYFLAALDTVKPGLTETARSLLYRSSHPATLEVALTALLNNLTELSHSLVVALDDYHLIESPAIHHSLIYLLERLPSRLHLALATRSEPPLPLARLRVRRQLNELRATDLRFSTEEAAVFLNQIMHLRLEPAEITQLSDQTEGWIAGLQLAALSLQNRERAAPANLFNGSHRYVLDYLAEEVLQRQLPAVQLFLMQTSILDRLCGSLCEAVTGQRDGQILLERLERQNLFTVPLDEQREWYRYHQLFAGFLRHRLRHLHPEQEGELHRRASEWYIRHGQVREAIGHALIAQKFEWTANQAGAVSSRPDYLLNDELNQAGETAPLFPSLPGNVTFPPDFEPLSDREIEVLHLIVAGKSNREIAAQLVVTEGTVKWHLKNIYAKLKVQSRTQAIVRSRELALL